MCVQAREVKAILLVEKKAELKGISNKRKEQAKVVFNISSKLGCKSPSAL